MAAFHTKNAIALERLKTEFRGKVEILPIPGPVLRDLKKLAAEVVREESEKTPMARKVHASFTKFQALVGPWDHVPRVPTISSSPDSERGATFYTTGIEHSPTSDGHRVGANAVARDAAGRVGGAEEEARERVGGARVEADEELHALLERGEMVKGSYRASGVRIMVGGKKRATMMESSFYLDMVMKRRNPPQK